MAQKTSLWLAPLLLLGPASAVAKPPTFTGNATADFDITDFKTYVLADPQDVTMQGAPVGTISGLDIINVYLHYDPYTDILYIAMQTSRTSAGVNIIAGDVDGDGNPGSPAAWLSNQGGQDWPDLKNGENFSVYIDVDNNGTPDYIVGKPGSPQSTLSDFRTAAFISGAIYQPYSAFGTSLPSNTGAPPVSPSSSKPHLEFTLPNFSKLPLLANTNPVIQDVKVGVGAYLGSQDDLAISEDAFPMLAKVSEQIFASPAGQIGGTVFRDWNNNGVKDSGEDLVSGITVRLSGDWNLDKTSDQVNVTTGIGGDYLFKPVAPTSYNGQALQANYRIQLVAPFGYSPSNLGGQQTTGVAERQQVTLTAFGLYPTDSDNDGIYDFEEGQDDVDGDLIPNYEDSDSDGDGIYDEVEAGIDGLNPVDSDNDGADDYLDFDADNDGIEDGDEGNADYDGDSISNYLDLDSDGDGIPDKVETQADKDGDRAPNFLDLDSDGDRFMDELEAGSDPSRPQDSDGDSRPNYQDQDSDDDGLRDGAEGGIDEDRDGLYEAYQDTDNDGTFNIFDLDSDADGIPDGVEAGTTPLNANSDTNTANPAFVPDTDASHTSNPLDQDSDDDCIPDGVEDADLDGARDADNNPTDTIQPETWPDLADSDGDGVQDGTELGYTSGIADTQVSSCITDADGGATTTNPNDDDTDGGGKSDGFEDTNANGVVDPGETNPNYPPDDEDSDGDGLPDVVEAAYGTDPNNPDTDGDGLSDGTEGITDVDSDGDPNAADTDSDGDGKDDHVEASDPYGNLDPDEPWDTDGDGVADYLDVDSDDDGLLDRLESQTDHDGDGWAGWRDPDSDSDGLFDGTESGVTLPSEGTSPGSPWFVADKDATSTTDPEDADSDDDGLLDGFEDKSHDGKKNSDESDPNEVDTDADCVQDGTELGLSTPQLPEDGNNNNDTDAEIFVADADPTTTTNPLVADTDGGSSADGGTTGEDRDCDGEIDDGETDPNDPTDDSEGNNDPDGDGLDTDVELDNGTDPNDADSDDDGLTDGEDGLEDHDGDGAIDALDVDSDNDGVSDGTEAGVGEGDASDDTDVSTFVPDEDPSSTTDPDDADTDDDGLSDGEEDSDLNGAQSEDETDPDNEDSDSDGLQDGTESGITQPGEGTDPDQFQPDEDPGTTTDPLDDDTDDDGLTDGGEDYNTNGVRDEDETDPRDVDTDDDCVQDGTELGITLPQGDDTDSEVFVPDGTPYQLTDPLNPDTDGDGDPDGQVGPDGTCDYDAGGNTIPAGAQVLGGGGWDGVGCNSQGQGSSPHWVMGLLVVAGLRRWRRLRQPTAALVLVLPTAVMADEPAIAPSLDTQHFHAAQDMAGAMVTTGTRTLPSGSFSGGAWLDFADDPLVLSFEGEDLYKLQDGVVGLQLVFGLGLADGLQFTARLPVTLYQWNDDPYLYEPGRTAIHDAVAGLKWRVTDLGRSPTGIAFGGDVFLPTGSGNSYAGGAFGAAGYLMADHKFGDTWVGANLGYRWRPDRAYLGSLEVDDEVLYRLGLTQPIGDYRVSLDIFGERGIDTSDIDTVGDDPLEIMVGASRLFDDGPRVTLGASTGLIAGYGVPDFRVVGGVAWGEPDMGDRDRDGIPDSSDPCPDEPEDFDGYQDGDGCPELDNDSDGISDDRDKCPLDPEDSDGFQDEDGCPDPDNDLDGLLDVRDRCPNDPEDKDGFQDEDGCPDPDNDKDGVPDTQDRCPEVPEDVDGYQDEDGCPDPDNDGDGVLDSVDKCPRSAENFNSFDDDDGCPDVKVETSKIKIDKDQLVLLEQIYFEFNKSVIRPSSYAILNAAIQVFKDNPNLKVRIEGHTDNKGSDEYNMTLSQARADAVKLYLVEQGGLDPGRFETVGYGETRPKAENSNDTGRALNRRIEWWIISR